MDMFIKFIVILVILLAFGAFYWYGFFEKIRDDRTTVTIHDTTFKVDVSETPQSRSKGLSGRERLSEDEGMLFVFTAPTIRSFWMKDMLIPIDIIWINENKIIGFHEDVQPEPGVSLTKLTRYTSQDIADQVLEVQAGTVKRLGIIVGDGVLVE